ncbi:hypothetical protein Lal_00048579 [Lupinus albus]|nr:hypothetical protein Lal_00048579 [Lupinus albus]
MRPKHEPARRQELCMFKGSIPALITPFTDNGAVDEQAFAAHVEWQIAEGSKGLVPVGSRRGCTAGGHPLLQQADAEGPVRPFLGRCRSGEIADRHLQYPPRSVVDMSPETMGALVKAHKNIVGVKDATGKLDRVSEQRISCGKDFIQLSGEDGTALGFNAHGGVGCISVTANVAPRLCSEFQAAMLAGDYAKALEYQDRLMPLHKAIFMEPGVCGTKYALSKTRGGNRRVRSPLMSTLEPATEAAIDAALKHAGLMN